MEVAPGSRKTTSVKWTPAELNTTTLGLFSGRFNSPGVDFTLLILLCEGGKDGEADRAWGGGGGGGYW